MKKPFNAIIGTLAIGLTGLALTGCSGGLSIAIPVINILASEGSVTITETKNATTNVITRATVSTPAKFTFRANRGSLGGNILGYRIISSQIGNNPNLIDPKKPYIREAVNMFVQSGFTCSPAPASTQSCPGINKDPANGAESGAILISEGGALESFMLSNSGSASIAYTFVFFGKDDTGADFEIPVKGLNYIGIYNRAQ
jgi:hypothetical protein